MKVLLLSGMFAFLMLTAGCATVPIAADNWVSLFDGQSLDGWQASENTSSVRTEDGMIVLDGPRSHLFYVGNVEAADFKNFEFKADVKAAPGANSGIYFHTEFQENGWPSRGYEVQVNNTPESRDSRELRRTGSLYSVRNVYKQLVGDNEWFTMYIIVTGNRIQVRVNDMLVVDYVEPETPVRSNSMAGRVLDSGTFALQCHDPDSYVTYRNIMVRSLPDDLPLEESPVVDENYTAIARLNNSGFPIIDTHIHLRGTIPLEDALARSRKTGIYYGIAANCGIGFSIENDEQLYAYLDTMPNHPAFMAMQGEGREWVDTFSPEAMAQFDYVFTDALTFYDDAGRRVRLWVGSEVFIDDKQEFMEMYINRIESVINNEPIDIFVNPTFLPNAIADEYDELWTEERMQRVIDVAVVNNVAIEINSRYEIPSAAFIKQAKASGAKFSLGTNNGNANYDNLEYSLRMIDECDLNSSDMFWPGWDMDALNASE